VRFVSALLSGAPVFRTSVLSSRRTVSMFATFPDRSDSA
jgi:hypothetical protein